MNKKVPARTLTPLNYYARYDFQEIIKIKFILYIPNESLSRSLCNRHPDKTIRYPILCRRR